MRLEVGKMYATRSGGTAVVVSFDQGHGLYHVRHNDGECYWHNEDGSYYGAKGKHSMDLQSIVPSTDTGKPGVKDDSAKLKWELLPWRATEGVVKVLTFGARKYAPNSWRTVPNGKERYQAAIMRHESRRQAGELIDPETGLLHSFHIACNAMFIAELEALEQAGTPATLASCGTIKEVA